jgi:hypothetical protein
MILPQEATEVIIEGIRNNRMQIQVGKDANWVDELVRKYPENYLGSLSE